MFEDTPDTQDVNTEVDGSQDQSQATPSGNEDNSGNTNEDQYFLEVNDRTKYRTPEDAVAAYRESGERISELTPYAEVAERFGFSDPGALMDYLNAQKAAAATAGNKVEQENRTGQPQQLTEQQTSQLTDADKQNIEYLKKMGFTPNEALQKTLQDSLKATKDELSARISALEAGQGQISDKQFTSLVDEGHSVLSTLLKEKGYASDEQTVNELADVLTARMNLSSVTKNGQTIPGSAVERFLRGGSSLKQVVKEQLDGYLGFQSKLKIQQDGQKQKQTQERIARTAKPMPKGSQHGVQDKKATDRKAPIRPGAGGIFTDPAIHDKAYELIQGNKS